MRRSLGLADPDLPGVPQHETRTDPSIGQVAEASRCELRSRPLPPGSREAVDSLLRRDTAAAERALVGAAIIAPEHPEILRLQGYCLNQQRRPADAVAGGPLASLGWNSGQMIRRR